MKVQKDTESIEGSLGDSFQNESDVELEEKKKKQIVRAEFS